MPDKNSYRLNLDIQFATATLEAQSADIFHLKKIRPWVRAALQQDAHVLIRLVNTAESQRLNFQYRGQAHATNVLTFTLTENQLPIPLVADIVLCMPVLKKEARQHNILLEHHCAHLIMHGVLHAQGFDHADELSANAMETLEIALLARFKIQNPYT